MVRLLMAEQRLRFRIIPTDSLILSITRPEALLPMSCRLVHARLVCAHITSPKLTYDFPGDPWGLDEFPKHLQTYIPNTYARPPTLIGTPDRSSPPNSSPHSRSSVIRSAMMRTVILMATAPISPGEEIFMDYRLNPELEAPDWYHQVDEKLSKKRWERSMY
jgi:hypothetical protein